MTETKHTPGPYKKWLNRKERRWAISTVKDVGEHQWQGLAWVWCSGSDPEDDEAEANADLFIAAPELLEACYAACEQLDEWGRGENKENVEANNAKTYRIVRAAIAKAGTVETDNTQTKGC